MKPVSLDIEKEQLAAILDGIDEVVYVADPHTYEVLYVNSATRGFFGDIVGEKCHRVLQDLEAPCGFCSNPYIFGENLGKSHVWEWQNQVNQHWYRCFDKALLWPDGRQVRFELALDVTEAKKKELDLTRRAEEVLEQSTPVLQVWEGVVAAPMIGTLDSARVQLFMQRFLEAIVNTRSSAALIDITGVPAIDTQTAQHLLEAIAAARLLGTHVILTGVQPAIAQTLVQLGIDMSGIETCSSLSAGIRMALAKLELAIVARPAAERKTR